MSTAKDLFIIAMDPPPDRSVGQGDLSLALAGAELIDLLDAQAVSLDGDRIVPGTQPELHDPLLGEAAAALTRRTPYERVDEWLWRRGRDLSAAYQAALEEAGELTRGRRGLLPFGTDRMEVADTPARRRALGRQEEEEPVLAALASVVGIRSDDPEAEPRPGDEAVTTVLAVVNDAVMELEAVRQRRTIENAAFANIWRGP
ncbi:GPP34 family phosphoprotein [Streptomyces avidinii]|uniref:GOLPH3/VPS74 family protein n=1 Tax=Streptomyces avidinii TaxID=1895 RepID=UPI0037BB7B88|nr:GPP34 family phosphoprotein [Streptomyces avidinii]WTA95755.1 GPP34 family phosphoprotein [Streptomyces avidinii]